jgi:hypothetical protein
MPSWLGKKFPAQVGMYSCSSPPGLLGKDCCSEANFSFLIARPYAPFFAAGTCNLECLVSGLGGSGTLARTIGRMVVGIRWSTN